MLGGIELRTSAGGLWKGRAMNSRVVHWWWTLRALQPRVLYSHAGVPRIYGLEVREISHISYYRNHMNEPKMSIQQWRDTLVADDARFSSWRIWDSWLYHDGSIVFKFFLLSTIKRYLLLSSSRPELELLKLQILVGSTCSVVNDKYHCSVCCGTLL